MNERPVQPPEGRLLSEAAERRGLSIREASRRAGISYGRWRQITSGVQNVSPGHFARVVAPAKTLARMATAVGVTPQELEQAGREDAAQALRDMKHRDEAATPAPLPAATGSGGIPVVSADPAELAPYIEQVWAEVAAAKAFHGPHPAGEQVFPADPDEARMWNREVLTEPERVRLVAFIRMMAGRTQTNGGRKAS